MAVETKIEGISEEIGNIKVDIRSINKKLDQAIIQKADKNEVAEVRNGLDDIKTKALFQAIGIIVSLAIAIISVLKVQ